MVDQSSPIVQITADIPMSDISIGLSLTLTNNQMCKSTPNASVTETNINTFRNT